ncbi:Major facilitator superfamily domain-containing protein 6 [Exaiptasia diaphana]|nr:Major facilitator superfamily domain-containing protein 6 [Exaiptasia diaphana]
MIQKIHRSGKWRISKEHLKRCLPSVYYYLFYGALGSLFPFLNIYYRSVGLNPWQIGLLGGLRPLVALFSGTFWCLASNRYKIRKSLLLVSLIGWIVFTTPIGFVSHGHDGSCLQVEKPLLNTSRQNTTRFLNDTLKKEFKRDTPYYWITPNEIKSSHTEVKADISGQDNEEYLSTSSQKRREKRSASSMTSKKNERSVSIGKPLPNSFGLMGLTFHNKPYKNVRKPYDFKSRGTPYVNSRANPYATSIFIEFFFLVLLGEFFQAPTDDVNIHHVGTFLEPMGVLFEKLPKSGIYSSVGVGVLALISGAFLDFSPKYVICGKEYEIGGSELNVGITVICQNISDSVLALSAPILMKYVGYIGMVFSGLASYAMRFLLFSSLATPTSAWAIPSVELLQGFSHSTAWSAFILYIINYTPRSTYPVGIFIVQGVYLGIGTTLGAILSGILIERLETNVAFRIFGLTSILSCLIFTLAQPTGAVEILPGDIEPTSNFSDEDEYSSLSEEELLFDYKKRNVIYIPPKDDDEAKFVLPSTSAPLVPTFMTYVNKRDETP